MKKETMKNKELSREIKIKTEERERKRKNQWSQRKQARKEQDIEGIHWEWKKELNMENEKRMG